MGFQIHVRDIERLMVVRHGARAIKAWRIDLHSPGQGEPKGVRTRESACEVMTFIADARMVDLVVWDDQLRSITVRDASQPSAFSNCSRDAIPSIMWAELYHEFHEQRADAAIIGFIDSEILRTNGRTFADEDYLSLDTPYGISSVFAVGRQVLWEIEVV